MIGVLKEDVEACRRKRLPTADVLDNRRLALTCALIEAGWHSATAVGLADEIARELEVLYLQDLKGQEGEDE
jgi:hypothetical protein